MTKAIKLTLKTVLLGVLPHDPDVSVHGELVKGRFTFDSNALFLSDKNYLNHSPEGYRKIASCDYIRALRHYYTQGLPSRYLEWATAYLKNENSLICEHSGSAPTDTHVRSLLFTLCFLDPKRSASFVYASPHQGSFRNESSAYTGYSCVDAQIYRWFGQTGDLLLQRETYLGKDPDASSVDWAAHQIKVVNKERNAR